MKSLKIAVPCPALRLGDVAANEKEVIRTAKEAQVAKADLIVFPPSVFCGVTFGDMTAHDLLLSAVKSAVSDYRKATENLSLISILNFPEKVNENCENTVLLLQKGRKIGKTAEVLPPSPFAPGKEKAVFVQEEDGGFTVAVSFDGAPCYKTALTVLYDRSPVLVGKEETKDARASVLSADKRVCVCVSALSGESSGDGTYGGEASVWYDGKKIANRRPFEDGTLLCEVPFPTVPVVLTPEKKKETGAPEGKILPPARKNPFLPEDADKAELLFETVLDIQARGLVRRMRAAYANGLVIGISGGLDSTLAVLVGCRVLDLLGLPRKNLLTVTMPAFGTTARTRSNAEVLCRELGTEFRTVPIGESVSLHFRDIGHDPKNTNVVFENAQARERTQVLMDIANETNALVVGTGDLSELFLGWATYNGDHMSMYGVNGGVPKSVIRVIVGQYADKAEKDGKKVIADTLRDILATPVSPELLPADENGEIAQKTEDLVGPYDLHDFYIWYFLRYGLSPRDLFTLAKEAFDGVYDEKVLLYWLRNDLRRFFIQQFKRTCLPDGPQVFEGISLSPRGGFSMPSDAFSALWLSECDKMKEELL